MDRLIKVYDNVIDKEYCNHLIDKFENNENFNYIKSLIVKMCMVFSTN